jgi:uncharacterized delta-60 repeat protein
MRALAAMAILAAVLTSGQAAPKDGSLDSSFSGDGFLSVDFGGLDDGALAVAVQPNGRILLAGTANVSGSHMALARLAPDGSLDSTFSGDGKVTIDIGSGASSANAIALTPDGRIVVGGSASNDVDDDFAVVRLESNGTLDGSFSGDGKQTVSYETGTEWVNAVAVQPDGRIVAAGLIPTNAFALVRLEAGGQPDTSFSGDGWAITPFDSNPTSEARAVALQPDGKIVTVGAINTGSVQSFAVTRHTGKGSLDNSFSGDGRATTTFASDVAAARAVAVQPDGKIVVAGQVYQDSTYVFGLVRYNANGTLDHSFSGNGKVTTAIGTFALPYAIAVQPDGRVVVAGYAAVGAGYDIAVARYDADGSLDTTFSFDGVVTIDVAGLQDLAYGVAIQPNGRIVVAGSSESSVSRDMAVARFIGQTSKCGGELVTVDLALGSKPTAKRDVIRGTSHDDTIAGKGGNDVICGRDGDDTIDGGSGHDVLYGGGGRDVLEGGKKGDVLDGGKGGDVLRGGSGDDTLRGRSGSDTLRGQKGDDTLNGGSGSDDCSGGPGHDTVRKC